MGEWHDIRKEKPMDGKIVLVKTKQHLQYKLCKYSGGNWYYRSPFDHSLFVKMSFDVTECRYMV